MLRFYSKESHCDKALSIIKAKHARIVHKEVYKAINDNVTWPRGRVMQVTFLQVVLSHCNIITVSS